METNRRPSPSYSLTLRVEYPNRVGMLGSITSTIGQRGGDLGAIDIVQTTRSSITRDITFSAADYEHGQAIIADVRTVPGVDVVHVSDRTFLLHLGGKLEIRAKVPVKTRDDLSMVYTPGVARIAQAIVEDPQDAFNLTIKKNTVAVVTDGTAVLGLGNAGPLAALPVMEAKAILLKEIAGIDAFPLCLQVDGIDEFVLAVRALAPSFGAIHLEDISAPRCFAVEERLSEVLEIPVMHNDQHGTAIVVLAALINAMRITRRNAGSLRVVINGARAAGVATANLLKEFGFQDITLCDETGALHAGRDDLTDDYLRRMATEMNPRQLTGSVQEALREADIFIGFGGRQVLEPEDIRAMNERPVVLAMANPYPEVEPTALGDIACAVATSRSDFPNQINNMLCFPGFFRGLLDSRASSVNVQMKLAAAQAIADVVGLDELHEDYLIPSVFDRRVAKAVASAVAGAARDTSVARRATRTQDHS